MPRILGVLVVLVSLTSPLLGAGRELGGVQPLAPLSVKSTVAAHGSRFLVLWSADWFNYKAIQFATFDDAGHHGPATALGFSGGWMPYVVSVDEGFAAVWRDGLTVRMAVIVPGGQVLRQFAVPDESDYPAAVTAANNRVALVFPTHVLFVDTTGKVIANRSIDLPTGLVSAATFVGDEVAVASHGVAPRILWVPADGPVATTSLGVGTSALTIAPAGDGVLAIWQRNGAFYSAAVGRSSGARLAGPLATDLLAINGYELRQTDKGYLFVYGNGATMFAIRLDSAGVPTGPPLGVFKSAGGFSSPSLAIAPSRALVAMNATGVLLENAFDLGVLATETVAEQPPTQRNLALASNHLDFMAAFTEGGSIFALPTSAAVATIRFDGEPAGVLRNVVVATTSPFLVGQQSVAFGGNVYAHVAHEGQSIVLRRFDVHGTLIDDTPVVVATSGGIPAVVSDGMNFFVAWNSDNRLQGTFISPAGEVGPVHTLASIAQTSLGEPRMAFDGTRFVVTFRVFTITGFPEIVYELPVYAVAMTHDGVAGQPVQLFETQQLVAPVASGGTDFLVVGDQDNELLAWSLVADGTSLRVVRKLSLSRGLDVAASVAWSGGQYVVVWRALGPSVLAGVDAPLSFLAVTHVRTDGSLDPVATIPTGTYDTLHSFAPAVAANDLGVELIAVDEIRQPGGSPRAVIYRSEEVARRIVPPSAPVITGARVEYDGRETVMWQPASGNERGYIVTAGVQRATVLAGTTQLILAKARLPLTLRVQAWNEAGVSDEAVFTLLANHRVPGRR